MLSFADLMQKYFLERLKLGAYLCEWKVQEPLLLLNAAETAESPRARVGR